MVLFKLPIWETRGDIYPNPIPTACAVELAKLTSRLISLSHECQRRAGSDTIDEHFGGRGKIVPTLLGFVDGYGGFQRILLAVQCY